MPAHFDPTDLVPPTLAQFQFPATTIMVYDKQNNTNNIATSWGNDFYFQNHGGRANFLFADGHVKTMLPSATGTPINMWNIANTTHTGDPAPGPADPALIGGELQAEDARLTQ